MDILSSLNIPVFSINPVQDFTFDEMENLMPHTQIEKPQEIKGIFDDRDKPATITYSSLAAFKSCRKYFQERYVNCLVPNYESEALSFGTIIHESLETWLKTRDKKLTLEALNHDYNAYEPEDQIRKMKIVAMINGYADMYNNEPFDTVGTEVTFKGDIINPRTLKKSRSFILSGKVDAIVKMKDSGEYFIMEHKTATSISSGYLEKLWMDDQTILYSIYCEKVYGIKIAGVIYDVIEKSGIYPHKGETEEEFAERYAEAVEKDRQKPPTIKQRKNETDEEFAERYAEAVKNKVGKTKIKRDMPETNEEFAERLRLIYTDPKKFHREYLYFSEDQFSEMKEELWDMTKAISEARNKEVYYKNTQYCFKWNSPCAYFQLCKSGRNPALLGQYRYEDAHRELTETNTLSI